MPDRYDDSKKVLVRFGKEWPAKFDAYIGIDPSTHHAGLCLYNPTAGYIDCLKVGDHKVIQDFIKNKILKEHQGQRILMAIEYQSNFGRMKAIRRLANDHAKALTTRVKLTYGVRVYPQTWRSLLFGKQPIVGMSKFFAIAAASMIAGEIIEDDNLAEAILLAMYAYCFVPGNDPAVFGEIITTCRQVNFFPWSEMDADPGKLTQYLVTEKNIPKKRSISLTTKVE